MKWFLIIWIMNNGTFTEIGPFEEKFQCGITGLQIRELHENNVEFICIEHNIRFPHEEK